MPSAILVVDDDRDIASVIADVLVDEGYAVSTAFDGQAALEAIERAEVDLLVSDIRMPRLDGVRLVQALRARGWAEPIVLMSAIDVTVPAAEGVVFLRKPVDLDDLLGVIERLLDHPEM